MEVPHARRSLAGALDGYSMSDEKDDGIPLLLDPSAPSAVPGKPAFLSKPPGAPVYHGFPLIPETCIDGWCYGAIMAFENPRGCKVGDGFVQAPDGSRAGLVWGLGDRQMSEISPPGAGTLGCLCSMVPKAGI